MKSIVSHPFLLTVIFSAVTTLGLFLPTLTAFASNVLVPASVNSSGYVTFDCPIGSTNITQVYNRKGEFPDLTENINNITSTSTPCAFVSNGTYSMEDGYMVNTGTTTDGFYWTQFQVDGNGGIDYIIQAQRFGGVWYEVYNPSTVSCDGQPTQFISLKPENGTTTSNDVFFQLELCVNEDDVETPKILTINIKNIDQNVLLLSALSPSNIELLDTEITDAGYFEYSTTTVIGDGNYRIQACYRNSYIFSWLYNPFSTECASNQFTVVAGSFIGSITQDMWTDLNDSFYGQGATSTVALANSCNPIGGNFSMINCTLFLFIPDTAKIGESLQFFADAIKTHFPWGYATDFMTVMSSSSTVPLIVIDATIPNAFPFAQGQHLTLDLTGVLDPILNANTGAFINESAPSSETFLEITLPYWKKIVYVLAFFYILARLFGSHLIPTFNHFGKQGALSDTNSGDDSYRLKEWLYKHKP